jgi:hypothetical protein
MGPLLYAFVIFTHLSGDPEDYEILGSYARALACQDAMESFVAGRGALENQLSGVQDNALRNPVFAQRRAANHERLACVAMLPSSPCITVMQTMQTFTCGSPAHDAEGWEVLSKAYPACRKALKLEGELPTPLPCQSD